LTTTPFLLVIAGPNGSGKTTLTKALLAADIDFGIYINPDDIAQTLDLPEPQRTRQAQAIADFKRDACLRRRESFSFETVLSHRSKIDVMIAAHRAGYDVTLYFVATEDPEINVRRVENRVAKGGHDVPHERIRARYARSLAFLADAALVARRAVVFDNSPLAGNSPHTSVVNLKRGLRPVAEVVRADNRVNIRVENEVPVWVHAALIEGIEHLARQSEEQMTITLEQCEGALD
jgi:predicted ABC-type ATPase